MALTRGAVGNFKTHTILAERSEDLHSSNVTEMAQKCLTLEDVEEPNSSLSQLNRNRAELCMHECT